MKIFMSLLLVLFFSTAYTSSAVGECLKGNCIHGQGSYTYPDNSIYVGEWKDGLRNGQGTYTYPDGSVYVGQWENDEFTGRGTFTYPDNSIYVGEWKDGMRNGQGTYTCPSGSKYIGQWQNDKLHGQATYMYPGGYTFVGQWVNGMKNGKGTYAYPDGSKYAGNWKNDRPIEEGVLTASDGTKVPGSFSKEGRFIVKKPGAKKPAADKAAVEKAEAERAAAERTAAEKAARKKVAAEKAAAERAAAEKVAANRESKPPKLAKGKTFTDRNGIKFVLISPTTFAMGSPEDEQGRYNNETQHQVTLEKAFYMQVTEVTQSQWTALMGNNPSFYRNCGDACPVEQVSWNDVQQCIWRLNQLEGADKYRLPTEAEWEVACRAGSTTAFASGPITELECGHDSNFEAVAWFCGNSDKKIHPVAEKKANGWGLYDMHGNVSELCQDWYAEYPPDHINSPSGPASGIDRIARGGGWDSEARHCRSACRGAISPNDKSSNVGFRLVRTP